MIHNIYDIIRMYIYDFDNLTSTWTWIKQFLLKQVQRVFAHQRKPQYISKTDFKTAGFWFFNSV